MLRSAVMILRHVLSGRRLVTGLMVMMAGLALLTLIAGNTPAIASMLVTRTPSRTPTGRPTVTPTITPTASVTPLPAKGQLYELQWAPDSKALYVYSSAGLWRYTTDPWSKPPVLSVTASAFGGPYNGGIVTSRYAISHELIATVGSDRIIHLWNPLTGTLINTLPALPADVNALLFSPDESLLVASTVAPEGAIHIWDLSTNLVMAVLPGDQPTDTAFDQDPHLTFSLDSQTLTYMTRSGEIVEWLRAANLVRSTGQPGSFIASRDGLLLAIINTLGNSGNTTVGVFDVRANALRTTLKNSDLPFQVMTFSPDNHALYAVSGSHFWHWSLALPATAATPSTASTAGAPPNSTPSVLINLTATRDNESGIYYNPARDLLARVSQFGYLSESDPFLEVRVQNMVSGSSYQLKTYVTAWGQQQVTPVAFSPDGAMLAVAGHNGVQVWDVTAGQPLALMTGYADVSSP